MPLAIVRLALREESANKLDVVSLQPVLDFRMGEGDHFSFHIGSG